MLQRAVLLLVLGLAVEIVSGGRLLAVDGLVLDGVGKLPHSRVIPGGVLVLTARVANRGDEIARGTLVANIEGFSEVQSARTISVEAGRAENFEVYIQLPKAIGNQDMLDIVCTLNVQYGNREVGLARNGKPETYSVRLAVDRLSTLAALLMDVEPKEVLSWHWPPKKVYDSYEMAMAARIDSGNERQTANFDAQALPLNLIDWQACDVIVIAEKSIFEDAAAVEAIRRYLNNGGRVWVMLDRVPCEAIRPWLVSDQACDMIDRVELNEFTVELASQTITLSEQDRTVNSDDAIEMTRVVQSGGAVTHEVRGWPAAIKMNVGYGELLLTTLGSRAWMETRTEQKSLDPRFQSAYTLRSWGLALAQEVNEERMPLPLADEVEYPLKHIGNPIVPRGWVALALAGFCGLIVLAGLWRSWVGDLGPLGLIGPLLAIVASSALLFASTWIRREIPESVSKLQVIDVAGDGRVAVVREQAAVYVSNASSMSLESQFDGQARAKESLSSGIRRFEVGDWQQWRLTNEAWPPGTWRYGSQYATSTEGLTVAAQLTAQGVQLELPQGLPSPLEDPLLGYVPGDPMLCTPASDGLVADGRITVDGERWISGSIISDEQQRRLEIYQAYFRPDPRGRRLDRVLYGWTKPWPGPSWDRDLVQNGSALVAMPVQLERPAVGLPVLVPHGLVQLRRKQNQFGNTSNFNDRTGKWASEVSMGTVADLEFLLPHQVVPFQADAIEFELDISAPQRQVSVSVLTPSGAVEVATLESPSIPWKRTINNPQILAAVQDGVLSVQLQVSERIDVSEQGQATSVVTWQIDHFHASLRGSVQAKPNFDLP